MERHTLFNLEKQAIELGATYLRHYFITVSYYINPSRKEVFSTHFFNSEHKEVCMFIDSENLFQLTGMTVFKQPRNWGTFEQTEIRKNNGLGDAIDFETRGVKKFN